MVLDICRTVYNNTLAIRKDTYEQTGKSISMYDTNKMLTEWKVSDPTLSQVHSQVLQNVQERVDLAFKAFFRRVRLGKDPGYPRFKGRWYDSFTFKQSGFDLLDNGCLRLSKIGDVKIKLHRPIEGQAKTLTIRRDTVGNWFACFSCEVEARPLKPTSEIIGIDLGLTTFAYFSDGNKIKRQRWAKVDARDIARLQHKKNQFEAGSPERLKVIKALQHAYQRQTNRRDNFAHQISRYVVDTYQFIALEDLDIANMKLSGNRTINKGINDVAWGKFVQYTTYKAERAGRSAVLVDPRGTSQMCSGCGSIVPKDLSVRRHHCLTCGLELNRDHNAAINILSRGLATVGKNPRSSPIYQGE